MKFFLPELLAKVNDFYKTAGVLKVPTQLESDVCNWIDARYCKTIGSKLKQLIDSLDKRKSNHQYMSALYSNWEKLYYLIDNVKDAIYYSYKKEEELPKAMDALIAFTTNTDLNIPSFSLQKEDPISNWAGVLRRGETNTLFKFERKSKDTYRFAFIANLKKSMFSKSAEDNDGHYSIKPVKVDVSKFNLSTDEAVAALTEQMDNIIKVCGVLEHFKSDYDYADPDYLKKLMMVYMLCMKYVGSLEDNASLKSFSISPQDMSFPTEFNKFKNFSLNVSFVTEEEKKNIQVDEDWLGVWFGWDGTPNQTGGLRLGTMYVTSNIEEDLKDIQATLNIDKHLVKLNDTVRHELQHFMQNVIDNIIEKSKGGGGGLPGKDIRDPNYSPSGRKLNKNIKDHPVKDDLLDESGRLTHALRDIEFYTRLSDEISKFNQAKTNLPLSLHQAFAYAWVGQITKKELQDRAAVTFKQMAYKKYNVDPVKVMYDSHADRLAEMWVRDAERAFINIGWHNKFFLLLKEHQPLKYQKAVKEFIKAVV